MEKNHIMKKRRDDLATIQAVWQATARAETKSTSAAFIRPAAVSIRAAVYRQYFFVLDHDLAEYLSVFWLFPCFFLFFHKNKIEL